jgi:hypothetical protein
MFGAPSGGLAACGHQGFEPTMVLSMVPPNGVLLPALMLASLFRRDRVWTPRFAFALS